MNNFTNSAAPTSGQNQAKLDKEKLQQKEVVTKEPDKSEPGLSNPANFGKHNPKFNKYIY